jgi:hypothetical protein
MSTDRTEWSGDANPLLDLLSTTQSRFSAAENAAPVDVLLKQELTALNELLTNYVLRFSDADNSRAETVSVAAELALADSVTAAANAIRARAERRKRLEDAVAPDVTRTPDVQPHDGPAESEDA